ncbi:MAG: hypothetical protein AMS14_11945 [Planctomycetes bacterium DG_20]|nr:MAG: hypothetical protein AMS14_11945 [Planctomycetes bacterium DG_20]
MDPRRRLRFVPVGRTRGCNFRCEFCAVHSQFGRIRWASPERSFEQVRDLWRQGHRIFFYTDDNFAQDRRGTLRLLRLIIRWRERSGRRPRFIIQARAEVGRDLELLGLMRRAGVTSICIGLESPIDEDLRAMRKGQSAAAMEAAVANIQRLGFYIHGMFIFGYPRADTSPPGASLTVRQRADRYLDFIRRTRLDTIQVMKPVPLPGTDLSRRLSEAGRIYPLDQVGWDKYDGNWVVFEPDAGTSAVALQEEATRIMRRFYQARNIIKWVYIAPISPVDAGYYTVRKALELWRAYRRERRALRAGASRAAHLRAAVRHIAADSLRAGWQAVKRRWRNTVWLTGAVFVLRAWRESFRRENFRELLARCHSRRVFGT